MYVAWSLCVKTNNVTLTNLCKNIQGGGGDLCIITWALSSRGYRVLAAKAFFGDGLREVCRRKEKPRHSYGDRKTLVLRRSERNSIQ